MKRRAAVKTGRKLRVWKSKGFPHMRCGFSGKARRSGNVRMVNSVVTNSIVSTLYLAVSPRNRICDRFSDPNHTVCQIEKSIESGIDSGRFSDANEIVREGLRLLEERERDERVKLEWLRSAAIDGLDALDRGDFTEIGSDAEMTSFMEAIHRDAVGTCSRR